MTLEEIVSEDFPEERHDLIFRLKATPSTKLNQSINQSINQSNPMLRHKLQNIKIKKIFNMEK